MVEWLGCRIGRKIPVLGSQDRKPPYMELIVRVLLILWAFPFALSDVNRVTRKGKFRLTELLVKYLITGIKFHFTKSKGGEFDSAFNQQDSLTELVRLEHEKNLEKEVHLIIPTKDKAYLLEKCVTSIIQFSSGWKLRITIVDNGSEDPETFRLLSRLIAEFPFIDVIRDARPFNYSRLNNFAFNKVHAEISIFLNNDVEILSDGWLEDIAELLKHELIAVVGQKLVYPNGAIQHFGVKLGMGLVAGHPFQGSSASDIHLSQALEVSNEVSAVTGACLAIKSSIFRTVGGFDENLPVGYNDVDLCMSIRNLGLKIVLAPKIRAIHHESQTRGKIRSFSQIRGAIYDTLYMIYKHGPSLQKDPFIRKP